MERLREEESGDDDDTEQPEDNELLPISLDEVCDEPEVRDQLHVQVLLYYRHMYMYMYYMYMSLHIHILHIPQ